MTYKSFLCGRGWKECEEQPGLFRKFVVRDGIEHELLATIYVDDTMICGSCDELVDREVTAVLNKFEGSVIKPGAAQREIDGVSRPVDELDVLGATVYYSGKYKFCCWTMEKAIDRLVASFPGGD